MERGLLWLPLLVFFGWLAWTGRREFQKVEAYQKWAEGFDRAKYDIYSVLGQQEDTLTWGKPTYKGMVDLETFPLTSVQSIQLLVNGKSVAMDEPPNRGRAELEFVMSDRPVPVRIPFTEPPLAAQWGQYLQQEMERVGGVRSE